MDQATIDRIAGAVVNKAKASAENRVVARKGSDADLAAVLKSVAKQLK